MSKKEMIKKCELKNGDLHINVEGKDSVKVQLLPSGQVIYKDLVFSSIEAIYKYLNKGDNK